MAGGRGTAVPVCPPAGLAVTSVTLDVCPSRVPPSEAACHAPTGGRSCVDTPQALTSATTVRIFRQMAI
jgi:hypothetical protein